MGSGLIILKQGRPALCKCIKALGTEHQT